MDGAGTARQAAQARAAVVIESAVAASLLSRAGRTAVVIDDSFDGAEAAGVSLTAG